MSTAKRPLSVTIIAFAYLALGIAGFAYHISGVRMAHALTNGSVWIELIFLAAILSGVFMLRGRNWARWLAFVWIAFHVVVSVFHTLPELAIHSLLCAILAYFLFRASASSYFRPAGT